MMNQPALSRRLCAEAFGTFCLVFAGTGAAVVNEVTGGGVTHVGVALTFGLVVMALVYALGKASGCHINPAVTLGLCAAGRFERFLVLPYIGGVIGLEALFAGPISGASMNPARSSAPAVVMMHFDHVWIYIVAPIAGALASVPLYYCIHSSPYCSSGDIGECS